MSMPYNKDLKSCRIGANNAIPNHHHHIGTIASRITAILPSLTCHLHWLRNAALIPAQFLFGGRNITYVERTDSFSLETVSSCLETPFNLKKWLKILCAVVALLPAMLYGPEFKPPNTCKSDYTSAIPILKRVIMYYNWERKSLARKNLFSFL